MRTENIAHFDLEPGNILRCGNVWKVTDFDAAEIVVAEKKVSGLRGTLGYTDPEVYHGGIATLITDLYSVGNILYVVTKGERHRTGRAVVCKEK